MLGCINVAQEKTLYYCSAINGGYCVVVYVCINIYIVDKHCFYLQSRTWIKKIWIFTRIDNTMEKLIKAYYMVSIVNCIIYVNESHALYTRLTHLLINLTFVWCWKKLCIKNICGLFFFIINIYVSSDDFIWFRNW